MKKILMRITTKGIVRKTNLDINFHLKSLRNRFQSLFFATKIVIKIYYRIQLFYERIFPQITIFLKNQLFF